MADPQQSFEFGEDHQSAITMSQGTGDGDRIVALQSLKNLNPRRVPCRRRRGDGIEDDEATDGFRR